MLNIQKITGRIKRAAGLGLKIDALEIEDESREMIKEDVITDVLSELLESLKNGESLELAISTIQENF